jgi:hypothetical protein
MPHPERVGLSPELMQNGQQFLTEAAIAGNLRYRQLRAGQRAQYAGVLRHPTPESVTRLSESMAVDGGAGFTETGMLATSSTLIKFASLAVSNSMILNNLAQSVTSRGSFTPLNSINMKNAAYISLQGANAMYHDYRQASDVSLQHNGIAHGIMMEGDERLGWVAMNWAYFNQETSMALELYKQFDSYDTLDVSATEQLRESNDELWKELQILRKYGVKPAIAPSPSSVHMKEWLIEDISTHHAQENGHRNLPLMFGKNKIVANFMGSTTSFVSSKHEGYKINRADGEINVGYIPLKELLGEDDTTARLTTLCLLQDGRVANSSGIRLDTIAKSLGCEDAYEQLRSELLNIFFDLTVPVYVHDLANPSEAEPVSGDAPDKNIQPREQAGKLRRLVLARTRVLRELGDGIIEEMEKELEQGKQFSSSPTPRAKHIVIGFRRPLPAGYKAGEEARQLCREELGEELPEYGETYVKTHERGSIEVEDKGHKAVYQSGKVKDSQKTPKRKKQR